MPHYAGSVARLSSNRSGYDGLRFRSCRNEPETDISAWITDDTLTVLLSRENQKSTAKIHWLLATNALFVVVEAPVIIQKIDFDLLG